MTEKQFKFSEPNGAYLIDIIDENARLKTENEEFKKALVELKEIGDYQEGRIKELNDENEQLEKRLQIYKSDGLETLEKLQRCYENSKKAMNTIDALDEENEQLKQRIKELEVENEAQSDAIDGLQEFMAHHDLEGLE